MAKARTRLFISIGSFVLCLVLLELGLRLGGYLYTRQAFSKEKFEKQGNSPATVLCVGDSYTYGGNGAWLDSYPIQLQKLLSGRYPGKFNVINGGICEANSTQVRQQLSDLVAKYKIDTVILLVGASNRFNFVGYREDKRRNILESLRLYKMAKIFMINLKAKIFQKQVESNLKKQMKMSRDYTYDSGGFVETMDYFCGDEQESQYKAEIEEGPKQKRGYFMLALCYEKKEKLKEAEVILKKAVENIPSYSTHGRLWDFYDRQGMLGEGEAYYKEVIAEHPDWVEAYVLLGHSYLEQGKHKEAGAILRQALSLGHDQDIVYKNLGAYYISLGKYAEGTEALKKGIELDPQMTGWIKAYVEQETGHVAQGQDKEVENVRESTLTRGQHQESVHEDLGSYYAVFGGYDEEIEAFKKVAEQNFNITDAKKLAELYIQQSNFAESLDLLFKIIKFLPRDRYCYQLQAKAYEFQNQYDAKFILEFLRVIERDNPALKNDEMFQGYAAFFKDESAMQEKIENWIRQDLEEIVELCKVNNIQLIIQNYPYPYHSVNRLLEEIANKYSLPFVDNRAVFKDLSPYLKYFTDSDHNTAEGHRVVAENICSLLTAQ